MNTNSILYAEQIGRKQPDCIGILDVITIDLSESVISEDINGIVIFFL